MSMLSKFNELEGTIYAKKLVKRGLWFVGNSLWGKLKYHHAHKEYYFKVGNEMESVHMSWKDAEGLANWILEFTKEIKEKEN